MALYPSILALSFFSTKLHAQTLGSGKSLEPTACQQWQKKISDTLALNDPKNGDGRKRYQEAFKQIQNLQNTLMSETGLRKISMKDPNGKNIDVSTEGPVQKILKENPMMFRLDKQSNDTYQTFDFSSGQHKERKVHNPAPKIAAAYQTRRQMLNCLFGLPEGDSYTSAPCDQIKQSFFRPYGGFFFGAAKDYKRGLTLQSFYESGDFWVKEQQVQWRSLGQHYSTSRPGVNGYNETINLDGWRKMLPAERASQIAKSLDETAKSEALAKEIAVNLLVSGVVGALSGLHGGLTKGQFIEDMSQSATVTMGPSMAKGVLNEAKGYAKDKSIDVTRSSLLEAMKAESGNGATKQVSLLQRVESSVDEIINWEKSNSLGISGSGKGEKDLVVSLKLGEHANHFKNTLWKSFEYIPSCKFSENETLTTMNRINELFDNLENAGIGGAGPSKPTGVTKMFNQLQEVDKTLQVSCWNELNGAINEGPLKNSAATSDQALAKTLVESIKIETECLNRRLLVAGMKEYFYLQTLTKLEQFCLNAMDETKKCQVRYEEESDKAAADHKK